MKKNKMRNAKMWVHIQRKSNQKNDPEEAQMVDKLDKDIKSVILNTFKELIKLYLKNLRTYEKAASRNSIN